MRKLNQKKYSLKIVFPLSYEFINFTLGLDDFGRVQFETHIFHGFENIEVLVVKIATRGDSMCREGYYDAKTLQHIYHEEYSNIRATHPRIEKALKETREKNSVVMTCTVFLIRSTLTSTTFIAGTVTMIYQKKQPRRKQCLKILLGMVEHILVRLRIYAQNSRQPFKKCIVDCTVHTTYLKRFQDVFIQCSKKYNFFSIVVMTSLLSILTKSNIK